MRRTTLKAILFDMDDTLLRIKIPESQEGGKSADYVAGQRVASLLTEWRIDVQMDPEPLGHALNMATVEAQNTAAKTHLRAPDHAYIIRNTLAALDIIVTLKQSHALLYALAVPSRRWAVLEMNLPNTLAALDDRGYYMGVITNSRFPDYVRRQHLADFGLEPYFPVVISSADLGWLKPHPRIFQEALTALGVLPEETVMIGADVHADIMGAKEFGLRTVLLEIIGRPLDPSVQPDTVIARLSELPGLLDTW